MDDDIFFSFKIYSNEFKEYIEELYRNDSRSKRSIKRGINLCTSLWALIKKKQKASDIRVLFCTDKFDYLIKELSSSFNITLLGANNNGRIKDYFINNIPFFFIQPWLYLLYQAYFEEKENYASLVLKQLRKFMIKGAYDIVILSNDFTVMERAMAIAAKSLNIPVVIIQHGYLCDAIDFRNCLPTGMLADYYWFWDDYEKESYAAYIKQNRYFDGKKVHLKTIGYPFEICTSLPEKFGVLFIGTSLDDQSESHWETYYNMVEEVYKVCCELKIQFTFRFHPLQKQEYLRDKYKNDNNFLFSNESDIRKDLLRYEVIVGDISTVLMEAALYNRIVIQILWEPRTYTLFKNHNMTYRVENNYDDLFCLLTKVKEHKLKPLQINDYYLKTNNCIVQDVTNEIENIVNHKIRNVR